jgi:hypothetical protein
MVGLGRQVEQPMEEVILSANIIVTDPPHLPIPDHVYRLVSGEHSPCGLDAR